MRKVELTINNSSFGKLNGEKIYFTKDLYDNLSKEKTRQNRTSIINLFKKGRALQGLKHLIETIKNLNNNNKLIFTTQKTKRNRNEYFINYQEYRRHAQSRFFPFYRETGLNAARSFLSLYFPKEIIYDKSKIAQFQIKKIDKQFPEIIYELTEKAKNKKALIEGTTRLLERLRAEKKTLKYSIDELRQLQKQSSIYYYQQKMEEFRQRMTKNFSETIGKNSWQNWIYENNWLFGVHYQTPIQKEKIGFDNIPDFLFPTLDGFIDILEIKKPSHGVIREDTSHSGSHIWSPETNKAIGQVANYIYQIELNQLQLKERIEEKYSNIYKGKIFTIKPRAFVLIGTSDNWTDVKRRAFRKLNYLLHGIEVITYSDLLQRAEKIISMYSEKSLFSK